MQAERFEIDVKPWDDDVKALENVDIERKTPDDGRVNAVESLNLCMVG